MNLVAQGTVATFTTTVSATNGGINSDNTINTGSVAGTLADLIAIDPDAGDTLTFGLSAGGAPENGTVTIGADGTYTYIPNTNFYGSDSFTFRATDAGGMAVSQVVSITVASVNDLPETTVDSAAVNARSSVQINVLENDSDADAEHVLVLGSVSGADKGTVAILGDKIRYNANSVDADNIPRGQTDTDTFTYTVREATAQIDTVSLIGSVVESFLIVIVTNAIPIQNINGKK